MELFRNKKSRALIIIMGALVLFSIIISHFYYKDINKSVDPRIVEARQLYKKYNQYAEQNELDSIFSLMDSIELIYTNYEHYQKSYEVGVLYNNKAATFLTKALYLDSDYINIQDSLINLAEVAVKKSIVNYNEWLNIYQAKDKEEVKKIMSKDFFIGLENYDLKQQNKYCSNRINEILESQTETDRRLSVAYTNLGIIYRHKLQYDSAAYCYKEAVDLWDRNLTAENNLNVLLGRPLRKRSFIQKLFPPNRD